jgi:chemotaxis protein MotB
MSHLKPRYFQAEGTVRDRWMVSHMDVLTILLIFFVAIAAQRLEPSKNESAVRHAQASVSAPPAPAATLQPMSRPVRQTLVEAQRSLEQHGLDLRMEPRGLVISIPQAVLFRSGADEVSPRALPVVAHIGAVLRDIPNQVSLVGHADAVPIHNRHFKNNWDLSTARSLSLLALLSRRYGIAESRRRWPVTVRIVRPVPIIRRPGAPSIAAWRSSYSTNRPARRQYRKQIRLQE